MKVEIEDRNLEPTLVVYLDDGDEVGSIPGLADPEAERDAMERMLRAVQRETQARCTAIAQEMREESETDMRQLIARIGTDWDPGEDRIAAAIRALGEGGYE